MEYTWSTFLFSLSSKLKTWYSLCRVFTCLWRWSCFVFSSAKAILSWFSVWCRIQKTWMCYVFFHLNFLNAQGILAPQNILHMPFFVNFLTLKVGDDPSVIPKCPFLVSWLSVNPSAPKLAILRKANHTFQWISLSSGKLLPVIFFACGVHKLNYIKNDFV